MAMLSSRPILWDIYEEHLGEAAWLWGEWEQSLDSPLYSIADVAIGPEERLLAHLDGLVLGGAPVAQKLLLPALTSDDLGQVAAAAWALVQAEDADHQDAVVEALGTAPAPVQAAIGRALWLSPAADISRLLPLWSDGPPPLRALIFDVFGPREPQWVRERLDPMFRSGQPPLVAAALRAVRRIRDREFTDPVRFALQYPHPEVHQEILTTGLALGLKETWGLCRTIAAAPGPNRRLALGLLAISPDPKDRDFVRSLAANSGAGRDAVWAMGFCADVKAVDGLLQAMSNPETAKIAGEGFTAITGVPLVGALTKPGKTVGPEVEEVGLDDPPPVVRADDYLLRAQPGGRGEMVGQGAQRLPPGDPLHPRAAPPDGRAAAGPDDGGDLAARSAVDRADHLAGECPARGAQGLGQEPALRQLAQIPKPVMVDRKMAAMHQQTLK